MAKELLQTISKDEIERAHFRSRRMFLMDMEHNLIAAKDEGREEGREEGWNKGLAEGLAEGRSEGLAEGLAEGRSEGLAEGRSKGEALKAFAIAKSLLKRKRPIDEIIEDTGLSREEVENLRDTD